MAQENNEMNNYNIYTSFSVFMQSLKYLVFVKRKDTTIKGTKSNVKLRSLRHLINYSLMKMGPFHHNKMLILNSMSMTKWYVDLLGGDVTSTILCQ